MVSGFISGPSGGSFGGYTSKPSNGHVGGWCEKEGKLAPDLVPTKWRGWGGGWCSLGTHSVVHQDNLHMPQVSKNIITKKNSNKSTNAIWATCSLWKKCQNQFGQPPHPPPPYIHDMGVFFSLENATKSIRAALLPPDVMAKRKDVFFLGSLP